MKKLGLALGSGASRGIAHIGFLKALEENGIKPDYIAGTSIGAVVGSFYSLGFSPDYMMKVAFKLRARDILDISPIAIKNGTLLKSKKLNALLKRYLGDTLIEEIQKKSPQKVICLHCESRYSDDLDECPNCGSAKIDSREE